MNRRAMAAVWVWWGGIGGSLITIVLGLLLIPRLWAARSEASDWNRQSAVLAAREAAAHERLEDARLQRVRFDQRVAELAAGLASVTSVARRDTEIPAFISELQTILTRDGVDLSGLAWQSRVSDGNVDTLPFSARFEADFSGFMRLLAVLENHPSRLRIDSLEFHSLDNVRHGLSVSLGASARFRTDR